MQNATNLEHILQAAVFYEHGVQCNCSAGNSYCSTLMFNITVARITNRKQPASKTEDYEQYLHLLQK